MPASAQSSNVIVAPAPVAAEQSVLPNPTLLGSGVSTLVVGYAPAVVIGIVSDHKGDNKLFIPVAGPWLNLGTRGCSGATLSSSNEPFQVSDGKSCGTSGIERAALITDGVVQGIGALEILSSLFVPQRRSIVVGSEGSSFSVSPTSFGGHGAGAVAAGRF
jgi:hypothetical protein